MRIRAWVPALLAGFSYALIAPAAQAADDTLVDTVAGYEIKRVNDPTAAYPCRMMRGYVDPKDNNAANALAFAQLDGTFIVSLVYEHWKWETGKLFKAKLSVDKQLIDADAEWLGNGTNLAIKVPVSHLPKFNAGKKIVLGFKDGTADFDLTGFKPAYEAITRCNRDAAAARTAARPAERPAAAAQIGNGIAATPAPPAPDPKPAAPAPAAAGPLPSENRAIAYLFALYDRWAFGVCDMRTTAKQRAALEAKIATLAPEMAAIDADLQKQVPSDPGRCPPSAMIEGQLTLLLDNGPEDFVTKMDQRATKEFRGIVQPILERLKPAAPPAAAAPAAEAAKKPLPSDLRIGAYLLGLNLQNLIQLCDIPTTNKQRAGIDARLDALRPEMAEVESTVREHVEKKPCPKPSEAAEAQRMIAAAITLYVEKSPEDATAEWDRQRGGVIMRDVKRITGTLRSTSPEPSEAQFATFLWGLVMQDKVAQCDIATTAKQRAGLDGRVAALRRDFGTYESLLRDQIKGKTEGCPSPDKAAEFLALLPLYIEATPEEFSAEMDRQTAARNAKSAAAEAPAPAKDQPAPSSATVASKPASCGQIGFPVTRADLVANLRDRLKTLGVTDLVARPSSVANHHRYLLQGADVTLDVDGPDSKVTAFNVSQNGDSSKREVEVELATASYIVATFTRGSEDQVAADMKARLGAAPVSPGRSEKFDTATVFYTKNDGGFVSMLIDNADAGDCKP